MKILKIFGVVVGIHVFALALIFVNPGCSSTNKAAPSPADTVSKSDESAPAPVSSSVPAAGTNQPYVSPSTDSPVSSVPPSFDPSAPAAASSSEPMVRFSPTRPGTPAAATLEAQPVADVTPASTYTVTKGDSLWTIAKKNHITVAELAAANNIKAGATVRLGQKLIIPGKTTSHSSGAAAAPTAKPAPAKSSATDTATPARTSGEPVTYVVKPGETLGGIAKKFGVKVGEIETANTITDPRKIRPGMTLKIPGWQAPAGKAGKSTTSPGSEPQVPPSGSESSPVQPAPQQDIDSGVKNNEPPVIKIEDPSAPTKV